MGIFKVRAAVLIDIPVLTSHRALCMCSVCQFCRILHGILQATQLTLH
jgi:hypothetical protein